jgi:adenylate cyclase
MRLRTLGWVLLVVCAVAPIFNLITTEFTLGDAVQGLVDGLLITALCGGWLLFLRDGLLRARLRGLSFAANLALNASVLLALFLLGRAVGQVVTSGDPTHFARSFGDRHLLLALPFFFLLAFAISFLIQMNRMIGANVLGYFVAGVYHRPREEERIFLFLDLEGSTQLAERLGSKTYYELLRRVVDDLSDPVVETEGEIYQYAGDEVVVVWRQDRGLRDANCVRCFFRIREEIARSAAAYRASFGALPRFRGGLHGGTVVAGELGDLKRQIVFVGDILNTAARLEEYAKGHGLELAVSGALLDRLRLPAGLEARFLEELSPRGKEQTIGVHSLTGALG